VRLQEEKMLKSKPWLLPFEGDEKKYTQVQVDEMLKDHFNQEQVNTIVAEEKRKTQERHKKLISDLEEAKKNTALTAQDRASLEQRIEDLQTANLTADEKQKREKERAEKEYNSQVKDLTKDRDTWQIKHAQLMIDTEITKAAALEKALFTEQIAALLIPKTKLVETLDGDGKPSGIFEPKVAFPDTDKNEKPIILELTVPEAVKRMKELPQYANLFHTQQKGGLGGTGSTTTRGKINLAKIARDDPKEYRRLRKEEPEHFA